MITPRTVRSLVWIWILISGLSACGGGGSSGPAGGGDIIDRSGRSIGTIKGFGSVIVNDVAYDTSSAIISVDDQPGQESDLAVGQVVFVEGTVNTDGQTGQADRISTDPALRGPIESIDLGASTLTVLGTQVSVVSSTIFDDSIQPRELATLAVGDSVEAYGFADADRTLVATLLTRSTDDEKELRGIVANLDRDATTFAINALTVDYSEAILDGFDADIANGDIVEVEGDVLNGSTLIAVRVEREGNQQFTADDEGTDVELEGLVTRFVSATDFDVNGVAVTTNAATTFEGGDASSITLNVRIEVEGTIDATGTLVADEVEFEQPSNLEALASVEAVDVGGGAVTLLGIQFSVDAGTALIDESDTDLQFFSLQDVSVGDFVKVKAFDSGEAVLLSLFKRINPEDKDKLKGPLSEISEPSLFISGAEIATDSETNFELNESSVSAAEFFAAIQIGDTINAEGQSPSAGVLLADSLEKD